MPVLSAAVAVIAGIGFVVGVLREDAGVIALAVAGALFAVTAWRSARISRFLKIFVAIFAVEYVVFAGLFLLAWSGNWPQSLAEYAPPVSLPATVAVFGILVYAVSFIPVIGIITRLTDPYFSSNETTIVPLGRFGSFALSERQLANALLVLLVLINQAQVGISVRINFFSRDWFDAIQKKDAATFWTLLLTVFLFWAAIAVIVGLVEYVIEAVLKIRWRRWLTDHYIGGWLDEATHYRIGLTGAGTDNPDQRIAEDVRQFITSTYTYSISLLSTVSSLVSFSIILWTIPADFVLPGTEIVIPGLPFWVALIYATLGTWLTHVIGKPLVKLEFAQEQREADFRFSLARLREYTEQVALLNGERAEKEHLGGQFTAIVRNYFAIVGRNLKLSTFTQTYFQASVVFPYIILAPYYFVGKITLGQMQQTAGAFSRVESGLTFFVQRYSSLASYKAVVDRLTTFDISIAEARALGRATHRIMIEQTSVPDVRIEGLALGLPGGRTILRTGQLTLARHERTLFTGPSGTGKSTLFRAVSGIWPFGAGRILVPEGTSVMLLPQRPYIPIGTLRSATTYPQTAGAYADAMIARALTAARLGHLVPHLDDRDLAWSQRLSGGEQQRLAIARALLARPDWLFLDEATSALDEPLEAELYRTIEELLPDTTVISIGHRSTLIPLHDRHIVMTPRDDGTFEPVDSMARAIA